MELNRAVAVAMATARRPGWRSSTRDHRRCDGYHLLPSVRADLLARLGRTDEARAELERAAALTAQRPGAGGAAGPGSEPRMTTFALVGGGFRAQAFLQVARELDTVRCVGAVVRTPRRLDVPTYPSLDACLREVRPTSC